MSDSAGDWCLVESDPGLFTELIKKFGTTGVQVEELWTMEYGGYCNLEPIHGLIFLFKWQGVDVPAGRVIKDTSTIYFAKQVINNACATQAVLSILLNCDHPHVNIGPELTNLKEFSMGFDPKMRGLAISNSETIRAAHNSLASQTLLEIEPTSHSKESDSYHFVSYVPINGRVYELDGLRDGPIDLGPLERGQDWMEVVKPAILDRIGRYTEEEIRFNLMAVVTDRNLLYEQQRKELLAAMENPQDADMKACIAQLRRVEFLMEYEEEKNLRREQELARTRHNYLPFIMELLKVLGEEGILMKLYHSAKERAAQQKYLKSKSLK